VSLRVQRTRRLRLSAERLRVGQRNTESNRSGRCRQRIELPAHGLGLPAGEPNLGQRLVGRRGSGLDGERSRQVGHHPGTVLSPGGPPGLLQVAASGGDVVGTLGFEEGRPGEAPRDDVMGVSRHHRITPQMARPLLREGLHRPTVDRLEVAPRIDLLQLRRAVAIQEMADE
jgi:hypothetical protein